MACAFRIGDDCLTDCFASIPCDGMIEAECLADDGSQVSVQQLLIFVIGITFGKHL